ncbi:sodium/hydrogen exchanger [Striga asiatica]|uniref:Sodium/hydrogen exchanger n=1 Tax=Striga asiatica TaxID=4170 RepID=A0A5A7PBY4_STRAF|nr:sodium/hydrogen exchanger [Striga asiatica]
MDNMGVESGTMLETANALGTSDHTSVVAITLFVTLLSACIVIGHLLEENRWMNESITALIIVKKKQFFRNFMTIILFGAVGTLISFVIISLGAIAFFQKMDISLAIGDYLAIGAIFAATDSVCTLQVLSQDETPLLYSLVFGEGVVNDATSVVIFNAVQNFDLSHINTAVAFSLIGNFFYLFISSTALGVATGLLSAYVIKKLYFGRHSTDREVAIMMLLAYLSYMLAELFYLSGILTVFFCGIVMSHYTWHNVTENSRVTTKHTFATLSFVAETFIFLYVGMDALDIDKWRVVSSSPKKSIAVSATLLGLTMVGRAAFVFPLSFLSNLTKKSPTEKIGFKQQITIWWAGLMRGAVSMALAYNQFTNAGHTQDRGNAIMITSTITVVLFSTVVFGLLTKPLIRFLMPSHKQLSRTISSEQPLTPNSFTVPLLGEGQDSVSELFSGNGMMSSEGRTVARPSSLRMLLTKPTHTVHYYWRKFDDAFMRPVFGGRGFVPYVPGSPTEHSVHQQQQQQQWQGETKH